MNNIILKKKNGVVSVIPTTKENIESIRTEEVHLCWERCKNSTVSTCPKIAHYRKRNIGEYDFITDGYQIYDKQGVLKTFIVSKCNNYEQEIDMKLQERIKKLYAMKEQLIEMGFSEEDVRMMLEELETDLAKATGQNITRKRTIDK